MPQLSIDRELDQLLTASAVETRYVDLALRFRRPLATLTKAAPKGTRVLAGAVQGIPGQPVPVASVDPQLAATVELMLLEEAIPGQPVPVTSVDRGASWRVPAGAELRDVGGEVVGTFCPETLYEAGGRWDLLNRAYVETPPQQWVNLDIQESQIEVVRFGADFLRKFKRNLYREHSVLFNYGARRGGKTWILLALMLAACLDNPGLLTGAVSVSHVERMTDIDRNVRSMIPDLWRGYRAWPEHCSSFLNGSTLTNISTKDKESTKRGQMDMYLLNEAAKMDQTVYENSLGGTGDRGGLVWIASNPPQTPRGEWVQREVQLWEAAIARGELDYPIHVIRTDWRGNAAINQEARGRVARILRDLNPRASDADDEGLMLPVSPRAFWEWHPRYSMPVLEEEGALLVDPEGGGPWQDITPLFCRHRGQQERELLVGVDFQMHDGIVASFWRVFGTLHRPILLCVRDLTVMGSEHDFLDEVEDLGYGPLQLLFIGDSSGLTQDYEHAKGKTSFGPFLARGWRIIPPTTKKREKSRAPKNPPISRSLRECNRFIRERRTWAAQSARAMVDCLANCDRKDSKAGPYPAGPLRHQADGYRYVQWWAEPPAPTRQQAAGGRTLVGGAL